MHEPEWISESVLRILICAFALAFARTGEAQWGSIKGFVKVDKPVPGLPPVVKKGDATAKDAAVCAAADIPNESVLVDPRSSGLANVVVFLAKRPGVIHPDLANRQSQAADFQVKGCRFVPHVLVVHTGQEILISSNDQIGHNIHPYPFKNKVSREVFLNPTSVLVLGIPEQQPIKVGCDIHPWMEAYWVVLDHPYASLTNATGEFEIRNLPVGDHEFRIWHERAGFLDSAHKIAVKEGMNPLDPIVFSTAKLDR